MSFFHLPSCRMAIGSDETFATEYIAHRPGGGLDVVISRTHHDPYPSIRYQVLRSQPGGGWRHVAGQWPDLEQALRHSTRELRYAVADHAVEASLLDAA